MNAPSAQPDNPYVGPRAFTREDPLFGRDAETVDLLNLLISERIVLLHAPSGAGKTSLIQAGLIPALEAEQFRPLPIMRVNRAPDEGQNAPENRYVASALRSLEDARGGWPATPAGELSRMTLGGYLVRLDAALQQESADPAVLIFDQFEEILTVDPADLAAKDAFFVQVGEALRERHRWALFSMRDEYVAALDPYLRHVPTRLAATFRLGLLEPPQAAQAIRRPAEERGVAFTESAADALIAELLTLHATLPDGTKKTETLPFVEPVQLQVVCHQFWERLPWGSMPEFRIEPNDVAKYAQVDDALGAYFDAKVAAVAKAAGGDSLATERLIREWIDANLITDQGRRAQLRAGAERDQALPEPLIDGLVDAYLIRREGRSGDRWYELTHDRLAAPIQERNRDWFEAQAGALAAAYDVDVARIAAESAPDDAETLERQIREWIGATLVTGAGTRARLPAGDERGSALREDVVDALVATALVRRRGRSGDRWYELAHDRLVPTIVESNARWLVAHLAPVQLRARQWDATGRRPETLLRGAELTAARRWFDAHKDDQPPREQALLSAFIDESSREQHARWQRRRYLAATAVAVVFALAVIGYVLFDNARTAASEQAAAETALLIQRQQQQSASLANLALAQLDADALDRALLLAAEAVDASPTIDARRALIRGLTAQPGLTTILGRQQPAPVAVSAAAVSPDGRIAATAACARDAFPCAESDIRFWDLATFQPLSQASALGAVPETASLAFSPDGRELALATSRGVEIVNVASGRLTEPFPSGDEGAVTSVAFSPDGLTLAAGHARGAITRWDARTREPRGPVLWGHQGAVTSLAFSNDGALASGGRDGVVLVWSGDEPRLRCVPSAGAAADCAPFAQPEPTTPSVPLASPAAGGAEPVSRPRLATNAMQQVAFSPDGKRLAAAATEGLVNVWDTASGQGWLAFGSASVPVLSLAFSEDGEVLSAMGQDASIQQWDLANRQPMAVAAGRGQFTAAAFAADGAMLVAGSPTGEVSLWDLADLVPLGRRFETGSPVRGVALNPDAALLFAAGDDGAVRRWDVENLTALPALTARETPVSALALSPDGRLLAVAASAANSSAAIEVWDEESGAIVASLPMAAAGPTFAMAFSPDGQTLAFGGQDSAVRLWTPGDPNGDAAVLTGHQGPVYAVAFSPDGQTLASGSADRTVRLWNVQQPLAAPTVLPGRQDEIRSLGFSPDGRTLASGGLDGTMRLWDLRQPAAAPGVLAGHRNAVYAVAFSPDGRTLVSAGDDGTIRLWHVETRQEFARLAGHAGPVRALSFAADGTLASGSEDGSVLIWPLGLDALKAQACGVANRNLSAAEWDEFLPDQPWRAICPNLPLDDSAGETDDGAAADAA